MMKLEMYAVIFQSRDSCSKDHVQKIARGKSGVTVLFRLQFF